MKSILRFCVIKNEKLHQFFLSVVSDKARGLKDDLHLKIQKSKHLFSWTLFVFLYLRQPPPIEFLDCVLSKRGTITDHLLMCCYRDQLMFSPSSFKINHCFSSECLEKAVMMYFHKCKSLKYFLILIEPKGFT